MKRTKPDIINRDDIEKLMLQFYEKVKSDKQIGFFFTSVIAVDWDRHIELMISFWENVLFHTGTYEGNPVVTHKNINARHPTSSQHFIRWLQLFDEIVSANFKGVNADKMKKHAHAIAKVMRQQL